MIMVSFPELSPQSLLSDIKQDSLDDMSQSRFAVDEVGPGAVLKPCDKVRPVVNQKSWMDTFLVKAFQTPVAWIIHIGVSSKKLWTTTRALPWMCGNICSVVSSIVASTRNTKSCFCHQELQVRDSNEQSDSWNTSRQLQFQLKRHEPTWVLYHILPAEMENNTNIS